MEPVLRVDKPLPLREARWTVGLLLASSGTEITACLASSVGHGAGLRINVAQTQAVEIPQETATPLRRVLHDPACPAGLLADLAADLADLGADVVLRLLGNSAIRATEILAVGVDDPGVWAYDSETPIARLPILDPARLAERTGLNVIDAFADRDLATGGQGGPLTALALWMLLRHPIRDRVLLDLGRTVHVTYLPADRGDWAATKVLAFNAGPGTNLLDLLTERLTAGQHAFDPGGHLAAQGRRLAPLIDHWLGNACFDASRPRWHPRGVSAEPFVADALQLAVEQQWSVRDLLCTATHFVAEITTAAIRSRLPETAAIDDIIVMGGGRGNGMLLGKIAEQLGLPLLQPGDIGLPESAIESAAIAVLAMLFVNHMPANATAVTGAQTPRILGRITPGSPQNWQRLLQGEMGHPPVVRPLRTSV